MKEVIMTIPVLVNDVFDGEDLATAAYEQLEDGWRFEKAQMVVIDRPDISPDDEMVALTNHKIVHAS